MKHDPRQSNREAGIFKGWCAIHYAAYTNNVAMLGLIWNYERMAVTEEDTIIEAIGTGFGNNFFLSKGSTPLHVAILNDNKEAVQMILNLIQKDRDVENHYSAPNFRGQDNFYISCVCWRCTSG